MEQAAKAIAAFHLAVRGRGHIGRSAGACGRGAAGDRGTRAGLSPQTIPQMNLASGDRTGVPMLWMPSPAIRVTKSTP
jgi:hypothetical protein